MIYTSAEKLMVNDGKSCIEEPEEFPMTYAEPALFQTKTQMKQNNQSKILLPDYAAQNYSLSTLLFRLFFDIHPYNGRLYETYDESSKMKRYNKCEQTWDKAYKYYTGYGHAVLNQKERNNVTNILNKQQYSKWMVVANWIFVAITLISLVCIPPFSVFRGQVIFGIIALVLETGIALVGTKWYKDSPFTDDVSFMTVVNFVIWMIFIMLRIGL